MKGFLKRDAYLLLPNLKVIAAIGIFFIGLMAASGESGYIGFSLSLYLFMYAFAGVVGLFSYDTVNHWEAYAATAPNGRRDMVTARYLLALTVIGIATAICLTLGMVTGNKTGVLLAVIYSGLVLCCAAVTLPVSYKFGGDKSRPVMLVAVGVGAAALVISGMSVGAGPEGGLDVSWFSVPRRLVLFPVAGLAALALSWVISRKIMAKKEF